MNFAGLKSAENFSIRLILFPSHRSCMFVRTRLFSPSTLSIFPLFAEVSPNFNPGGALPPLFLVRSPFRPKPFPFELKSSLLRPHFSFPPLGLLLNAFFRFLVFSSQVLAALIVFLSNTWKPVITISLNNPPGLSDKSTLLPPPSTP